MRCISCSYDDLNNTVKVRDNYFPADHELALMTVCYPCAVEYVEVYKKMMDSNAHGAINEAFDRECYETSNANVLANEEYRMAEFLALDDMEDTMHFDPASLFFSHPAAVVDMSRVYNARDPFTILRQRSLIFSDVCSAGDKFAANALGTYQHACL